MNIKILEKHWGNLIAHLSSSQIDFLPRITIQSMTHAYLIMIGGLNFTLQLTLWTKDMREYLKNAKW